MVVGHIGGSKAKAKKILNKAKEWVLIVDEAYTLSSTSGKDYGKEAVEAMMSKMNADIDGKAKTPFFTFAGYPCEMEDFLRVNRISCSSTIIRRWNWQKSPTQFCLFMK